MQQLSRISKRTARYLLIMLALSLAGNGLLLYARFDERYPRAAYVSFVGVDNYGRCATGQTFLSDDPDSRHKINNAIMATEAFEGIKRVVFINKWTVKNDSAEPPEVKLIKKQSKGNSK